MDADDIATIVPVLLVALFITACIASFVLKCSKCINSNKHLSICC